MKHPFTVGSMFAGIGGICFAFEQAGFKLIWANEFDEFACKTYSFNFAHTLSNEDVTQIKDPVKLGKVDVITAGFPCQAFSVAGNRKGFSDPRGNLFFETARFIEAFKPKAFLLENVKNLEGHDHGKTFKVIRNTIKEELGYSFIPFVLNSKEYGNIPQTRERIYMVGFRKEADYEYSGNEQTLFNSNKDTGKICTLNFKMPSPIPLTRSIYDLISQEKQPDKYYYKPGHHYYPILSKEIDKRDTIYQWRRVYVRENKSRVCPTLTANMGTGGHNVPLIRENFGIRKLTPRECFRFQGFHDSFILPESLADTHLYKQAGNSVVVPVVHRIAAEILRVLQQKYKA